MKLKNLTEEQQKEFTGADMLHAQDNDLIEWVENLPPHAVLAIRGMTLNLEDSAITKLPHGLYVMGNLDMDGCNRLSAIPADMYVERDLYMVGTSLIQGIPRDLEVDGELFCGGVECKFGPLTVLDLPLVNRVYFYGSDKRGLETHDLKAVTEYHKKVRTGELRLAQAKVELSEVLYEQGFGHLLGKRK